MPFIGIPMTGRRLTRTCPTQMMYTIARYYSTSEHMSRLFTKLTNQVL